MSSSSSTNDLRNRVLFTIFILSVYRFGTFVPLPGIDPEQLKIMMDGNQKGLLGMFNVFAGGAVSRKRKVKQEELKLHKLQDMEQLYWLQFRDTDFQ